LHRLAEKTNAIFGFIYVLKKTKYIKLVAKLKAASEEKDASSAAKARFKTI
jgi:hypothetical protein